MNLFPVDFTIAIGVDVRDDASHGVSGPNPNTMKLEHEQATHTHDVAKPQPSWKGYKGIAFWYVLVVPEKAPVSWATQLGNFSN